MTEWIGAITGHSVGSSWDIGKEKMILPSTVRAAIGKKQSLMFAPNQIRLFSFIKVTLVSSWEFSRAYPDPLSNKFCWVKMNCQVLMSNEKSKCLHPESFLCLHHYIKAKPKVLPKTFRRAEQQISKLEESNPFLVGSPQSYFLLYHLF